MTDATCLLLYTPLILAMLVLLIATFRMDRRQDFVRRSLWLYGLMLGWLVCEALCFVMPTAESLRYMFDFKLIFIAFVPVATFFMHVSFYRLQRLIPRWLAIGVCVFPAVTAAFALVSPLHSLLLTRFTVLSLPPVTRYISVRGPLFYAMAFYSGALLLATFAIISVPLKNMPRSYREGSRITTLSLVLALVGMVIEATNLDDLAIDVNVMCAALSCVLFYVATIVSNRLDYLHIKRREVYQYLDEPVIILSDRDQVVETNTPADRLLSLLGADRKHPPAFGVLLDMLEAAHKIRRAAQDAPGVEDLYVLGAGYPLIYRMRRHVIAPTSTLPSGELVLFQDITNNTLFMERLREMAGVDELTGLPNRFTYQQLLRELDVPQHLPLSIIIGDLNGLKATNDTLGHHAGDRLLQMAASVLSRACPKGGHVARIGGDEFVMLLPDCTRERARAVLETAQGLCAAQQDPELHLQIALGCATKEKPSENINALITRADRDMYDDKGGLRCE